MKKEARICLVRHGKTEGNIRRGYIGCRTDEDLCEIGRDEIIQYKKRGIYPAAEAVYLSPMKRCRQTAEIIWPGQVPGRGEEETSRGEPGRYKVIEDFRECDFGVFDGKSYAELNGVPDYQHWIDSGGEEAFPEGESPGAFAERSVKAFRTVLKEIFDRQIHDAALSVHGGTIMSIMSRYGIPERGFYDWHVWNGDGYLVTVREEEWETAHRFSEVRKLIAREETGR